MLALTIVSTILLGFLFITSLVHFATKGFISFMIALVFCAFFLIPPIITLWLLYCK